MITHITGQFVDIPNRRTFPAKITIDAGAIKAIEEVDQADDHYIMPGFIDAHIHIESSMLVPYEFAKIALTHGTVATVSDPHEIANVMGIEGVQYMIDNASDAKLKFHFGAPSCVPATQYETAGAQIGQEEIQQLMASRDIYYLSEMMNYPGVLANDPTIGHKIASAKKYGKPVDGHAPGLRGKDAEKYIAAGISTDHECVALDEAIDKLSFGMKIIIREGSAAKNFNALHYLIKDYADQLMFCSDDKHPDDLIKGHINQLIVHAIALGYDLYDVLSIGCINPVHHYNMRSGILRIGDPADFILVKDVKSFEVIETYIDGVSVMSHNHTSLEIKHHDIINNFNVLKVDSQSFKVSKDQHGHPVIKAFEGSLITKKSDLKPSIIDGYLESNIDQDVLKIAVINRYKEAPLGIGFITGFGITEGAIASTVAHDSHNIICIGTSDEFMLEATNALIQTRGGLAATNSEHHKIIALPIAGLMSPNDAYSISTSYSDLNKFTYSMGCQLSAPFMTLSFMALLVIPNIKISDKGLFDAEQFEFY